MAHCLKIHPADLPRTTTVQAIRERFGGTVLSSIPAHPDHLRAVITGTSVGADLSRLPCGCIGIHNPATINAAARAEWEKMMSEPTTHALKLDRRKRQSPQELLDLLLSSARDGHDVDPAAVAAAREEVELDRLRAEGQAERDAAAAAERLAAERAAVREPVNAELAASEAALQATYTAALDAIHAVCDAADRHAQLVAEASTKTGDPITSTRHTSTLTMGDTRHDFWDHETYLLNLYWAVDRRQRRIISKLPPRIVGGPRP